MSSPTPDWRTTLAEDRNRGRRSFWLTLTLSLLLGFAGADRLYLGYPALALIKLLTFGGLGTWWLLDIILILSDNMTDADGDHLRR